jgi:hypothetical protein
VVQAKVAERLTGEITNFQRTKAHSLERRNGALQPLACRDTPKIGGEVASPPDGFRNGGCP